MTADDLKALVALVNFLPKTREAFIEEMEATWDGSASAEFWVLVVSARAALNGAEGLIR